MSFLSIDHIEYHWESRLVLPRISFSVAKAQFACLLGPSGCGKTTLLRVLAGLEAPQSGEVVIDGVAITSGQRVVPPEARNIGMVFQQPTLFPTRNVAENIGFGLTNSESKQQRIDELLAHIGLADRADAMPHELSGGQQHRVALARALAPSPKLLLLDEPFAHLDPERRQRLRNETKALTQREGVTCLMVTHDAAEAMQMGDRLILMDEAGHIRQQGTAHDVYHQPVDRYAAMALGEINLIPAHSDGKQISSVLGVFEAVSNLKGEVMFGIRPNYIEVHDAPKGIAGTIEAQLCTGPEDFLNIRLTDGILLQARLKHTHHWRVGDTVGVSVTPDEYYCFAMS